ncbi:MAG: aldose epimerase family protein [Candidatus Gastranaerophilaceae bacterium]
MPIDFNPHIMFNINKNIPQKVVQNQVYSTGQPLNDSFTKVSQTSDGTDFNGIKITQKSFGTIKKTQEQATLYTITNKNGASVNLSTFGATITSIRVPDKNGNFVDVTQGYNKVTPYEDSPVGHAGGTIGPYANKINGGKFKLDGKEYTLECNKDNGKTHSHGGTQGFDTKNWKAKVLPDGIEFTYLKPDMESGYPGNVETKVTYKFDNNNNLHIIYDAKTDKDTIINLTNHSYFNLDGAQNTSENSVLEHTVTLPNSSKYTQNSEIALPTGEIKSVENTPLDFRQPKKIGQDINSDFDQLKIGSGYDQNYCIDNYDGKSMIKIAKVKSNKTGIVLEVSTNMPGFQFYTANHLGKPTQPAGKNGSRYEKRSSFCIEPQFYPNAINTENFAEKGILKSGETFNREITYKFSVE